MTLTPEQEKVWDRISTLPPSLSTDNVTNMADMFKGCSALKTATGWEIQSNNLKKYQETVWKKLSEPGGSVKIHNNIARHHNHRNFNSN